MRNKSLRIAFSVVSLFSVFLMTSVVKAGSIKLADVVQVVSSNPDKLNKANFTQLRLEPQDEPKDGKPQPQQTPPANPRVLTEEVVEVTEEPCDCEDLPIPPVVRGGGFPWWILGFGGIPLLFLVDDDDEDHTPTPTPPMTPTQTQTPTETPTPTPTETPTPTPTETPTPTPTETPPPTMTPTPKPIPEPLTLLLFGTGLAGLGAVARRRWKKNKDEESE